MAGRDARAPGYESRPTERRYNFCLFTFDFPLLLRPDGGAVADYEVAGGRRAVVGLAVVDRGLRLLRDRSRGRAALTLRDDDGEARARHGVGRVRRRDDYQVDAPVGVAAALGAQAQGDGRDVLRVGRHLAARGGHVVLVAEDRDLYLDGVAAVVARGDVEADVFEVVVRRPERPGADRGAERGRDFVVDGDVDRDRVRLRRAVGRAVCERVVAREV